MSASAGAFVNNCISVGGVTVGVTDFTNMAAVFQRFTIRKATLFTLPWNGFSVALPSFRGALAVGYFNDGLAVASPTSYTAVLSDEQSKLVSSFALDPNGGKLAITPKAVQDPWVSTNSGVYTAA
jgi:hypothetical protein